MADLGGFTPDSFGGINLGIPSYSVTVIDKSRILNLPPNGQLVGIEYEDLVRPFTSGDPRADAKIRKLIARRPGPLDGEATLEWGGPSSFELRQPEYLRINITGGSDEDETATALNVPTITFEEHLRETETIRVENPEDSQQYVHVDRINRIVFKGPDLRPIDQLGGDSIARVQRYPFIYYEWTLNHPEGTPVQ